MLLLRIVVGSNRPARMLAGLLRYLVNQTDIKKIKIKDFEKSEKAKAEFERATVAPSQYENHG